MGNRFESTRLKIAGAKKHILDLDSEIKTFFDDNPYERVKPDLLSSEYSIFKFKLVRQIPNSIPELVGDAAGKLRAALDHAVFAVASAVNGDGVRKASFPFSRDADRFENNLKGTCKDVPQEIYSVFRSLKPYRGGNDLLFALNEICNGDKHKFVTPVGLGALEINRPSGGVTILAMPNRPSWDSGTQEMDLMALTPKTDDEAQIKFTFFVAFNGIQVVSPHPVVPVLNQMANHVEQIVDAIESAARKHGFIE